jgi:hypothetical protein
VFSHPDFTSGLVFSCSASTNSSVQAKHGVLRRCSNSANTVSSQSYDFTALAGEFGKLRQALLERAQSPEHYTAIGAIASAEVEAKSGDASRVNQALSALGTAGRWVLYTSKEIGASLVAEVLKARMSS